MSCASTGRRTRVGRLRSGRAGKANAALYHLTALFRWHASFIEFRPACTHGRSTRTAHTLYPRVPKTAWFSLTDSQSALPGRTKAPGPKPFILVREYVFFSPDEDHDLPRSTAVDRVTYLIAWSSVKVSCNA